MNPAPIFPIRSDGCSRYTKPYSRQQIRGINTTIKDRYFNSAAATPATIFPILGNLCQKHLRKLDKGLQTYYNQQICKIKDILSETYPTRLSLPQQGSFDLGYYHQTQKRYAKKEDK